MTYQAKVIYDFEAVADGELTVKTGDIITVASADVGEGWIFTTGVFGKEGIVPEAYVERVLDTAYVPARQVSQTDSWGDDDMMRLMNKTE